VSAGATRAITVVALVVSVAFTCVAPASGAPQSLQWDPPSYDFGPVTYATGPSEAHEFTLTNIGVSPVVIQNWRYRFGAAWPGAEDPFWSPADTATPCLVSTRTLEPGESCSIEIVFEPLHPGNWWSSVRVRGEGEELWTELGVSGEAVGPWVPVTPSHLSFESVPVGATTMSQTIVVENQDPEELTIEGITTSAEPLSSSPFRVVGGTCDVGGSLAPGATCTIKIAMSPTEVGILRSELEISDSAPDSPQSVGLEGAATPGPVNVQTAVPGGAPPVLAPAHTLPSPSPGRRRCPKGRHRIVKKGHQICAKKHRAHKARSDHRLATPGELRH
jgi:hypothetical protein